MLLFDEDGRLFILHDPATAADWIESVDELVEGFDGLGRPVRACGGPGRVELELMAAAPQGEALRKRVERYYSVFATRHLTRTPPQESDLATFVRAVADDWVEE
ncbi:hypothetical protein ACWGRL_28520 [[Kitasatospora] papulosa]